MNDAQRIFKEGSQTYYYSATFFPDDVQDDVASVYGFVRTADDYVDQIPQDEEGFNAFREAYNAETTENDIIQRYKAVSRKHGFDDEWTEAFLDSMAMDLERDTYDSVDDIKEYMYGSAEVIGLMLHAVLGADDHEREARLLGRGMQYLNFIRDIQEDFSFGRQYIPTEVLDRHGLDDLAEETARANPDGFKALIQEEVRRGQQWLDEGRTGIDAIPGRAQTAVKTAARMYDWTGEQIKSDPLRVYEEQLKPSMTRIIFTGLTTYFT